MSLGRIPLIAGNWKMNGLRADGIALAKAVVDRAAAGSPPCEILMCPPATLLTEVGRAIPAADPAELQEPGIKVELAHAKSSLRSSYRA